VKNKIDKFAFEFFVLSLMLMISWGGITELVKIVITHLK